MTTQDVATRRCEIAVAGAATNADPMVCQTEAGVTHCEAPLNHYRVTGTRKGNRTYFEDKGPPLDDDRGGRADHRINGTISMSRKAPRLALRESQTACLVALRHRKCSTPRLAIEAKLDIKKTAAALRTLTQLGLAEREGTRTWRTTARGATCRFETGPDRPRRTQPGPSSQRLLDLLDRPMTGSVIAEKLGVTRQRVRQLIVRLHALGRIAFGDPDDPFGS